MAEQALGITVLYTFHCDENFISGTLWEFCMYPHGILLEQVLNGGFEGLLALLLALKGTKLLNLRWLLSSMFVL